MKRTAMLWTGLLLVGGCSQAPESKGGSDSMSGPDPMSGSDSMSEATGSTSDETDGSPDLGPCADYVACVMGVTPEAQTTVIATYGDEGACWDLPGVSEADCWAECEALLAALHTAFPDAEACWECATEDDCTDPNLHCLEGTCTAGYPCDEGCPCPGLCFGTCELEVAQNCDEICQGTCSGTCSETDGEGNCNGMCDGTCEGNCLMPDGGLCAGGCYGTCLSD